MRYGVRCFLAKMCCVSGETQEEVTEETVETGVEFCLAGEQEIAFRGGRRQRGNGWWFR